VLSGGSPVSVAMPYGPTHLPRVNYVQKADTAFFAHESIFPQRLQRFSETQWALTDVPFITQPFEEQGHYPSVPLTLGQATPGSGINVTAEAPGAFLKTDVGRHIAYGGGYAMITGYTSATQATVTIKTPFPSTSVPASGWNLEGSPQGDIAAANKGRPWQQITLQANFQYFETSKAITGFIGGNGNAIVTGDGEPVLVIGDSWSVGLGQDDLARSWAAGLPGEVHVAGFSGSGFSAGASGCGRVSFADRATTALATRPQLVVVEGGLNDFNQPAAAIERGFRDLMADLAGHPVVVVGPAAAPARADAVPRVDELLADLSEAFGVPYVATSDLELDYLADRLHLTEGGHEEFGAAVAERIAEVDPRRPAVLTP